jgi:hypothetical protein
MPKGEDGRVVDSAQAGAQRMSVLIALVLLLAAQSVSPWAYTLEDQNEPEYLALRTQYGTFRVLTLPVDLDWGCGYVVANQNVQVEFSGEYVSLTPDGTGWMPSCQAHIVAQMDSLPCFTNEAGDCDVRVENG